MRYVLLTLCGALAGCGAIQNTSDRLFGGKSEEDAPEVVEADEVTEPEPIPATAAGWIGAKTTIASLGDPTTPGRWLETPLVDTEFTGRVVVPRTGAQAYIALVPAPGPEGGGSRLSLDAMRALLLPLDELAELEIYSN